MQIELRSDTFTKPTPAMREAIAGAEVGDDVFCEDPTINKLEEKVAAMTGKEAALFVASGTMGNQVAIASHTRPGEEVICDSEAHIFWYEAGGPAFLSGVQLKTVEGKDGILRQEQIQEAIRPENIHFPPTSLICLENTLNRAGGRVFPLDEMEKIKKLAEEHEIKVHVDGARLWNAAVATGIPLAEYGRCSDSISLCFSKGLGAPVGSILVGDSAFVERARRVRKIFGGGMRQAGIIAAGALHALEYHYPLLKQDHTHAGRLAEAVGSHDGIEIDLGATQTNIIIMRITSHSFNAEQLAENLRKKGVLVLALGERMLRAVTHIHLSEEDIENAIRAFDMAIRELS